MRAGHEPVNIVIQVPLAERSQIDRLGDLPIRSSSGMTVPLRELGTFERVPEEAIVYRKDLRGVEYVVADVGGALAAPVYAMLQVEKRLDEMGYVAPDGVKPESYWLGPPPTDQVSGFEWAGEWTVTYETFRDMGAAFGVALVLIYILVVWEFGNFRIPLVIMAPIPLTLLGIIPAHWAAFELGIGGEFTATSMIGWIALAGIIVRNSILLVDFSIHEVQKGVPVAEAVIRACKTRTRPIVITALALVAGSSVIFTDPIFQGMAISLSSGVLVSTILTLIVIPLGCVAASKDLCEVAVASAPPGMNVPCAQGLETDEPQPRAAPAKATSSGKRSGALAKIGRLLMLILYALRGIFLLLFDWLKGLLTKKRGGSGPSSGPGGGNASSGPLPNALRQDEQQDAAATPRAEATSTASQTSADEPTTVNDERAAAAASAAPAPASAPRKKATGKKAQTKKAAAKRKTVGSRSSPSGTGAATKKAAPKAAKKPSRRGIRLKTDEAEGKTNDGEDGAAR
jgi:hypothetical protein